jgi:hypothetical protein
MLRFDPYDGLTPMTYDLRGSSVNAKSIFL